MKWIVGILVLILFLAGCNMNVTLLEGDNNTVNTTTTDGGTDVGVTEPSYTGD